MLHSARATHSPAAAGAELAACGDGGSGHNGPDQPALVKHAAQLRRQPRSKPGQPGRLRRSHLAVEVHQTAGQGFAIGAALTKSGSSRLQQLQRRRGPAGGDQPEAQLIQAGRWFGWARPRGRAPLLGPVRIAPCGR